MNHIKTHMLSLAAELQAVDFSTQPSYQVMKQLYYRLVNQHHMPSELVAELLSGMSINISSNAWTDQELVTTMVNSTASAISRLYRQLEIDFGPKLASLMTLRMCGQFSITM
jgi:hypothetical protein